MYFCLAICYNNILNAMTRYVITRYWRLLVAAVVLLAFATSCMRQNYLMFEDGDFDGMEFTDYDLIQNAELDIDDIDR